MEYDPTDQQSAAYYTGQLILELGRAPVPTPYRGSAALSGHARNYDPGAREHADREAAAVAEWLRNEQVIYTSANALNNSTKAYYKRIIEEERTKRNRRGYDIERVRQEARTESYHATDYGRRKANPGAVPPSPSWFEPGNLQCKWCPCCYGTGQGWADAGYDPRFPREMILRYRPIPCECCKGHQKLCVRMGGGRRTKQKSRRKTHRTSKRLVKNYSKRYE
jgi:hypothetical protein